LATVQLQRAGFTTYYSGQTEVVTTIGDTLDYQYIKTKNATDELEVYFNFAYDGNLTGEAQRRRVVVTGSTISVADTLASGTEQRRMPFFKNSSVIAQNVLVTLTCDVRPAIYQLLRSTAVLRDIQPAGTALDISDPDTVLKLGVAVNGPITGSWSNDSGPDWGSHLMALPNKALYDDGTHGDAVVGDSIFTAQFQFFKDSSDVIGQEFKFGIGGGDNEGGFGNNHVANIDDSQPTAIIQAQFGSIDPAFYDTWDFDKRGPSNKPSAVKDVPIPAGFALEQNYPNPFNPDTRIAYKITKRGDVRLAIYNLLGEKVATLVDMNQNAGKYEIVWDGKNSRGFKVASGVYLYKLEAGEFTKVKKMLLLK